MGPPSQLEAWHVFDGHVFTYPHKAYGVAQTAAGVPGDNRADLDDGFWNDQRYLQFFPRSPAGEGTPQGLIKFRSCPDRW